MTKNANLPKASAKAIAGHLRMLTETIGVRLAGSAAERAAAEYLAGAGAYAAAWSLAALAVGMLVFRRCDLH